MDVLLFSFLLSKTVDVGGSIYRYKYRLQLSRFVDLGQFDYCDFGASFVIIYMRL